MATEKKASTSDAGKPVADIGERVKKEKAEATRLTGEAWSAAKDVGADAASAAQHEAEAQGDRLKDETSGELDAFASAIRAASDKLSEKQPGMVADLMDQAAGGLQGISEALQRKSSGEIVDAVRDFGRRNPMAFIAGSVLTGFALGRFAGSSATHRQRQGARPAQGPATNAGAAAPGASAKSARTPGTTSDTMRTGG
jgi:F0F1-type ATP synthase membrane subunit b/b'